MNTFWAKIKRFVVSEEAATAVEYAVILALILLVCFASIAVLGTSTNALFQSSAQSLEQMGKS